jgi:hypothetical protein
MKESPQTPPEHSVQGSPELRSDGPAEELHSGIFARAEQVPRHLVHRAVCKVKHTYGTLVKRYGPGYARAIVGAGLVGLPLPIPCSSALTAAPVLAAAEVHRALADKHIVPATVATVSLTVEHIETLGKHWVQELLTVFTTVNEQPGEFETLVHKTENDLGRPLTQAEQRELLVKFLVDVENPE